MQVVSVLITAVLCSHLRLTLGTGVNKGEPCTDDADCKANECGETWNDASENCELERFCGYDDSVCPEGMECFDYTNCHAGELTFKPTQTP